MNVKLFVVGIIAMIILFSCGTSAPDNKVYASDSALVGWDHAKPVYSETVLIKPTWSQSFHYAKQGGWGLWLTLSIILFVAFGAMIFLAATDRLPKLFENQTLKFLTLFILLAGALACFGSQPGSLKWNNDKWVPKTQFDNYMNAQGNITPIWDSLANNCKILWGPDKGCKDKQPVIDSRETSYYNDGCVQAGIHISAIPHQHGRSCGETAASIRDRFKRDRLLDTVYMQVNGILTEPYGGVISMTESQRSMPGRKGRLNRP